MSCAVKVWVKFLLSLTTLAVVFFALCISANAAQIDYDYIDGDNVRCVGISQGGADDTTVIKKILNDSADSSLKLEIKSGEYHITSSLPVYSNTEIEADGAVIYQDTDGKGILINASAVVSSLTQKGGYNSLKNVEISGGTWVGTSNPDKTKTKKSNGYYVGYSTFLFMHAQDIEISDCSFINNYNGHFIELAGVKNAVIEDCNMANSNSKYVGELSNEAIQIDNTYSKSNSPTGSPWDDTACKNITIKNCNIDYARGIGTNKNGNTFFDNIKITGCKIKAKNEGINLYDTKNAVISKCTVRSTGKKNDYTSSGIYVGLESKLSKSQRKKSVIKITSCKVYGYHAGIKISVAKNNTKFGTIRLEKNKIYSSRSKKDALKISYNGKQITKLIKKSNTIKKKS